MKRALAATLLTAAALTAMPAHAAPPSPGGRCEGSIDVACNQAPGCAPDWPCTITFDICLVWVNGGCKVG